MNNTTFTVGRVALLGVFLLAGPEQLAADVFSDFEIDLDGWTKRAGGDNGTTVSRYLDGDWGWVLRMNDAASGNADYFSAPAKFLGDWNNASYTAISFDYRVTAGTPDPTLFLDLLLYSGSTDYWRKRWDVAPLNTHQWAHFSVELLTTEWTHSGTGNKSWEDTLADVTGLYLDGEVIVGSERNHLDNFRLISSDADFDEDGDVDGNDLARWQADYGIGSLHTQGDADADGDVDGRDFLMWQRQFGRAVPLAESTAVPESASVALLSVVALIISSRAARMR